MVDSSTRLYLRLGRDVRGPFTPTHLHELAAGGAISLETESAEQVDGPWTRLATRPFSDELFPRRPELQFKAAEFEAVNRGSLPPVDHHELIAWANLPPPAATIGPGTSATPAAPRPEPRNDVLDIVREVARAEAQHAKPMVIPKKPLIGRRGRLLLAAIAAGNVVVVVTGFLYRPLDPASLQILGGWAILYTIGVIYLVHMLPRER
ncbi:MAG TPA: hypothetical protein VG936_06835 [Lacunisphaera sp.]|nr:hypothetical protein [Lacunisphaera sp.]